MMSDDLTREAALALSLNRPQKISIHLLKRSPKNENENYLRSVSAALWIAVLHKAIVDYYLRYILQKKINRNESTEEIYVYEHIDDWFYGLRTDIGSFHWICEQLGKRKETVISLIENKAALQNYIIATRGVYNRGS